MRFWDSFNALVPANARFPFLFKYLRHSLLPVARFTWPRLRLEFSLAKALLLDKSIVGFKVSDPNSSMLKISR